MDMHAVIETIGLGFAGPAVAWFVVRQYRQLQRINRGVRLLNYIVDRANEREQFVLDALRHATAAEAA